MCICRERIGKLEILGNDNAERDKARQMEEDRRFLDELARRDAQQAADEERRKQKLKEDKINYRR